MHMKIEAHYDKSTYTLTYIVWDENSKDALIIDPVLDYDPGSSQTGTQSVDALISTLTREELRLRAVLETHAHADHLSGSQILRKRFDVPIVIGARITEVQSIFKGVFDLPESFATDGSQFDRLVGDDEIFELGTLKVRSIWTPGHTPACVSYVIGDAVFTGDALFMPDYGTGRADFPGGSASALYDSIHERLYTLPDQTRVFVGHDYQPGGRALAYETTIGQSKRENLHVRMETQLDEFVQFREERDSTLASPRLLFPSVQINVDAGRLPAKNADGRRHLRIPVNLFQPTDETGERE